MEDTLTLSVRPKPGVVVRACKSSIRGLGGWGAKGQGFNTRFRNMSLKIVQAPETPPKPLIPVPHIKNVARELYTGNYKTALRATYKALRRQTWVVEEADYSIFCDLVSRFSTVTIKLPAGFCADAEKLMLKSTGKHKGSGQPEQLLKSRTK